MSSLDTSYSRLLSSPTGSAGQRSSSSRQQARECALGRRLDSPREGPPPPQQDISSPVRLSSRWEAQVVTRPGTRPCQQDSSSEAEVEAEEQLGGTARQAKVKLVIRGERRAVEDTRYGGEDEDEEEQPLGEGPVLMSRRELEEMIVWETNNLYDYLRGLYAQGLEEAQAGHEFDKEAWERRMAQLRGLLQQRDREAEELRRLVEEQDEQLDEREGHIAKQAELIHSQAAQIRELLRQVEQQQASLAPEGGVVEPASTQFPALGAVMRSSKKMALPQMDVHADAHFLQLPAQPQQADYLSYREYDSCGLWQALSDSLLLHRKRWIWGGCAAFLLLLLIILLATLVPRGHGDGPLGPQFLQAPVVSTMGASYFDVMVQLDQPALVSYMLFQSTDQHQQVPGTGKTLLELIQSKEVSGAAVVDASAQTGSLAAGGGPQPGLQQLSVACGWAPVLRGSQNERISLVSVASSMSAVCMSNDVPRKCARCPRIVEGTDYTILLVATSPATGSAISDVQVLNSVSKATPVNINAINAPFASNVTARSFVLNVQLKAPGTLHYAVVQDTLFARYGPYDLSFSALAPSSSDVLSASAAYFEGGLVANGSFSVPAASEWVAALVEPPCVAGLCRQSLRGLQGGTSYKVYLVSVDRFGNVDPSPLMMPLTTAPDTSPPALLPPSGPRSIAADSFAVDLSMDAAGSVYYMILSAKPGAAVAEPQVDPGSWITLPFLPSGGRRRLFGSVGASFGSGFGDSAVERGVSRGLLESSAGPSPGTLVLPTCYPSNATCSTSAASVFGTVPGLSAYDVVGSGCAMAPAAGEPFGLPPAAGLQNNTVYYVLLATQGTQLPTPTLQASPTVYAVRTVDLSQAKFACGFPLVTNITASGMVVSAMLTKPAWSFFVVLPTSQVGTAPSAMDILRGQGAGGQGVAAAGNMSRSGTLPWEAGATARNDRKLWASVTGIQSGTSYTVFLTLTLDGNTPIAGSPVARVSDVFTPATIAPTFTSIQASSISVDEASGTFSLRLNATLDRPGVVFYALYRDYSCITSEPSVADLLSAGPLPASVCPCSEPWYCSLVTVGNLSSSASSSPQAVGGRVSGGLAPLPFESLRDAPQSQLTCFRGGLGQASDTYNIYVVAGTSLPTYTGLSPQCSNFAQAMATAAAAAASGPASEAFDGGSCPAAPAITCAQAQLKPDMRIMQSAAVLTWPQAANSSGGATAWQPPPGANVYGRPAKLELGLEGGEPPAFTYGPEFPPAEQLSDGVFMQFKLNKPAVVIYAVRSFPSFDPATSDFPTPVLVSTGRVPVFDASLTHNATIKACSGQGWPAGPMQPNTQFSVQFVARDKYGRMDGPCPAAHPSCLNTATTRA